MLKFKRENVLLVSVVIFSLLTMYGVVPIVSTADAASLTSVKDTLSDSDVSIAATHTVEFNMGDANPLTAGQYVKVTFDADFTGLSVNNVTCPTNTSRTLNLQEVICTVDADKFLAATTTHTITIALVNNPADPGPQDMTISTHLVGGVEIESSSLKVYIIDDVTVTAHVNASLTFTIGAMLDSETVNGVGLDITSTATSVPFGTITSAASTTIGQSLAVSTNAAEGFAVTVQQTDELKNGVGSSINSFNNSPENTGSTTPVAWTAPAGVLDRDWTYGHMGLTTDDDDLDTLGGGGDFSNRKFAGLNNTDPLTVMHHDGPADGETQNKGLAHVAYRVAISDLQEAGDYSTTLTYVCTPTY